MATASFNKLSPDMIENNFGSTPSCEKMARIVTGSVADKIAPNIRLSRKLISSPSTCAREYK
jgi:hypothetical protein